MGSHPHHSPFTPNSTPFGSAGGAPTFGSGAHGMGERPLGSGASPFGGGPTPKTFARAGDLHSGGDPWSSFLLPSAAPRTESAATPASRFGAPSGGAYGFGQAANPLASPAVPAGPPPFDRNAAADAAADAPPVQSMLDEGADAFSRAPPSGHAQTDDPSPAAPTLDLGPSHLQGPMTITDTSDGFWVTAFGFPPDLLAAVLHELQPSASAILAHKQGGGNWMHVRLSCALEQEEALAKNGRIVHGSMIGVLKGILPRGSSADSGHLATSRTKQTVWFMPPAPDLDSRAKAAPSLAVGPGAQASSGSGPVARLDIHPYTGSGLAGMLTRATEYFFGW